MGRQHRCRKAEVEAKQQSGRRADESGSARSETFKRALGPSASVIEGLFWPSPGHAPTFLRRATISVLHFHSPATAPLLIV
jgi:hypothetical protein